MSPPALKAVRSVQGPVSLRSRDGGLNAGEGAAGGLGFACGADAVERTERPVGASVPTPVREQGPGHGLVLADGPMGISSATGRRPGRARGRFGKHARDRLPQPPETPSGVGVGHVFRMRLGSVWARGSVLKLFSCRLPCPFPEDLARGNS